MAKRQAKARYVEQYGALWRMTEKKYHEFLKCGAKGEGYSLDDFGQQVADNYISPLDWGVLDYERELKEEGDKS